MKCEVCSFDSAADQVLLKCTGCPRVFHAACVGLNLQRNSLRSKKVDFGSFLLPCCESCQELVQAKLNYSTIIEQQKQLTELLHINTEETHRIALHHEKPNIIHDAVEGLEILMQAIKLEISALSKNSSLAGNVTSIKNHVSSLIDTAILASKECMSTALESVTSSISSDMHNIHDELNHLQQLTVEIAANCTMTSNPVLELDILDELKSLSANLATIRCTEPSPPTPEYPSLEVELNKNIDVSGWRFLGTKKVWKADWSEYDARQLRRNEQQKIADNARKRKNRQQRAYNSRNRCNNTKHYKNFNRNKINNNNNYNLKNNNNFNYNYSKINSNNSYTNNNNNYNHNKLPSDRELLAAAKDRFSRPPPLPSHRPIHFQRGEVLYPYPASDEPSSSSPNTKTSCHACACRHSCFA